MREWEFNSGVAIKLIEKLTAYQVEILRVDDPTGKTDVPLATRTKIAKDFKATAYISIHGNAGVESANGIETFVYTTKPKGSVTLATNVQKHLIAETSRRNRGVKYENFHVLRENLLSTDSILIEGGFFTNKEELALMKSDSYREKVANAILKGLLETYTLRAKPKVDNKPVSVAQPTKVKMVKVIYKGSDGLNVRTKPDFSSKVGYVAKYGEAFTIDTSFTHANFYKLKSGLYITKSKTYVEVIEK